MKGKKDPKKAKQGRPLKELLPVGFNKPAREIQTISVLDTTPSTFNYETVPPVICPTWPGDEIAVTHDFGFNSSVIFEDDHEYCFPPSFYSYCNNGKLVWRLPDDIAPINESFKLNRRPSVKKNLTNQVSSKDQSKAVIDDIEEEKGWVIVTFIERDETFEELEIRKQKELEKFVASKKKGKPEEIHIGKVKEVKLNNIDLGKDTPLCCKWVGSLIQLLKDKN